MHLTVFSPLLRQYVIIITVNLSILCVGLDLAWPSPVLVKLRNPEETPLSGPITESEGGWIVAIGYAFSVLTLPCISYLLDNIGRKYSIIVVCMPKIVAGFMTIFATEVWMLLIVRIITGMSNTGTMMLIMIYCTEIASKEIRGALGSLLPILSSAGVLIMLSIGPYISYLNLSIMFTAIITFSCIVLIFVPDTPYSLYRKGKIEEAEKVLIFLRGSSELAEAEMKEFGNEKPKQKFDKREMYRNKANLKALIIAMVMGFGVQSVGFNSISFYLQTILEISNTQVSPALGSLIIGVIQILSSICTGLVSDRFGRRPILITTLLGMALGMIGLGLFFILQQNGVAITGFLNYLPLISIAIITWSFSGGIGSQYFVLITELLDGPARAIGTAASFLVSTIFLFSLTKYMMELITAIGPDATFMMFGVICISMCLFVFFFVPETKKKTIAEIQMALRGEKKKIDEKTMSGIEIAERF